MRGECLRGLVYLVIYDSGKVSLEHLLLSRHPSQEDVMKENPLSQPTLSLSPETIGAFLEPFVKKLLEKLVRAWSI